jgi:hypothetical protein
MSTAKIHLFRPDISVVCRQNGFNYTNVYVLEYDIKCKSCPDGTEWSDECNDCVPVCFDQFLEYLNNWNSSFSS